MKTFNSSSSNRLGLVLFYCGVFLAFILTALLVWADVEAISYGFPRLGNQPLRGLSCPPFMNRTEGASFSLTQSNTTERVLRPRVQVLVSEAGINRWTAIMSSVEVEPGERKTASWEIGADNIVLGNFVLIKAYTYASYPQPNSEGSCGIFVVNIPWMTGDSLYWLWLVGSMVLLITGLWLGEIRKVEAEQSSGKGLARRVLAGLAVIGLTVGSLGWWPIGIVVLVVTALTILVVLVIGSSG